MSDQSTEEKIKKWEAKKKSGKIIDVMSAKHTDAEVLQAGLAALVLLFVWPLVRQAFPSAQSI